MKKKNILVVYIITKLELGGAQKVCLSLFNGLTQKGCSAHLISGNQGPLLGTLSTHNNVILLPSMQREISWRALLAEARTFIALIRSLKKLRKKHPQLIVHTHSTKAGILGRWAAFFARANTRIHTIHGFAFHEHQSWLKWLCIYLVELITSLITTHFICVSAKDVKTGIHLLPQFKERHSIIRAGVEWNQFHQASNRCCVPSVKQSFIFGSVSCFKPQKNLIDLLKAFELVYQHNSRARLEIVGDGIERALLEKWIKEHELKKVITLHGWQQPVAPIMKTWHAFVLSSLWEGLPCAAVEARLLHLPVLSYTIGGIGELINHEQNGLLAKPGDFKQLAYNMQRTMLDQDLYRTMQSYPDNLKDFNIEYMVDNHITLYRQLLSGRPGQLP